MRILILPILLLNVTASDAFAQDPERQYLSELMASASKRSASYYRVPEGRMGEGFVGRTFTMDGKLKVEGIYVDMGLSMEHGEFTFYHSNGQVESRGSYIMGNKSGVWQRFDEAGRPLAERIYDPEPLANIIYSQAHVMPRSGEGDDRELVRYIREHVSSTAGKRLKGTAVVSFIVERTGDLSAINMTEGISDQVDQQVLDAIRSTAPWQPGLERGQPVRVRMRIPVKF